jgi:hypothetical protein
MHQYDVLGISLNIKASKPNKTCPRTIWSPQDLVFIFKLLVCQPLFMWLNKNLIFCVMTSSLLIGHASFEHSDEVN